MRMRVCAAMCAAMLFAGAAACAAQTVSSEELIARPKDFDGTAVVFRGEVIGDIMIRGGYAWINVHDGKAAIGVWAAAAMARGIAHAGNFRHSGDIVEIEGTFNRACVEHGGDMDIHAQVMKVASPGAPRMTCSLNKVKKDWVIKLLGVVAIVWILTLLKTR
ncbi:MAG TPA: DNA-binding protein [Candidatus Omnitrophota bacterium]|nr:DNA-binding protein [Candidatus Omnitrophota bacterium]